MHGLLVAAGLLLLSAASFMLALPILDFTGILRRLFADFPVTPATAARLALAGAVCLLLAWLWYRRRGGV